MNILKNAIKHFMVVTHHRWVVFKLCIKAGIPFRGLIHDLSKYSPTEFIGSVKYFNNGTASPITLEKEKNGYSKVWLHHKGRNKHHPEYWYDTNTTDSKPIMPFKYTCEMICDQLAAGIVYEGKYWTKDYQLKYWQRQKDRFMLNDKLKEFETIVLTQVAQYGIDDVINKRNLKQIYDDCIKGENVKDE